MPPSNKGWIDLADLDNTRQFMPRIELNSTIGFKESKIEAGHFLLIFHTR